MKATGTFSSKDVISASQEPDLDPVELQSSQDQSESDDGPDASDAVVPTPTREPAPPPEQDSAPVSDVTSSDTDVRQTRIEQVVSDVPQSSLDAAADFFSKWNLNINYDKKSV